MLGRPIGWVREGWRGGGRYFHPCTTGVGITWRGNLPFPLQPPPPSRPSPSPPSPSVLPHSEDVGRSAYCRELIRNAWLHFRLFRGPVPAGLVSAHVTRAYIMIKRKKKNEGNGRRALIVKSPITIALAIKYFHGQRLPLSPSLFLTRSSSLIAPAKLESRDCSVI